MLAKDPACSECDRLWRELAKAATVRVNAVNDYGIAVLRRDLEAVDQLTKAMDAARERCQSLREAVAVHQRSHGQDQAAVGSVTA